MARKALSESFGIKVESVLVNASHCHALVADGIVARTVQVVTTALFLQGCGGDIKPVLNKSVTLPRDGEMHGNQLGLKDS